MWEGLLKKYLKYLPVNDENKIVTLNEGNTPLIRVKKLDKLIGKDLKIYFKYEGLNPTGSFKDRGMTMAVTNAVENGSKAVICASTGNTSASAAAYAARAGLKAFVLIPEGKIALGKLSQAMMHGAKVIQVRGNFDEALNLVREIAEKYPITLVNSLNPYRLQGQKTGAFEIVDALGDAPDYHCLPVGNAGNITAYWMGYTEYKKERISTKLPKMLGFQAEGSAPIVRGYKIDNPETVATAIRIGNPASWEKAEKARDESGGLIDMVSDEEILHAYKLIASQEGVFCEPASAATIAGLLKLSKEDFFKGGETIVCTLTGHGLKDPDNVIKISEKPVTVDADFDKIIDIVTN
jgi:threonine synthase